MFIPLALSLRPQEEEAEATHTAQAGAKKAHIQVNPRSFALVDVDDNESAALLRLDLGGRSTDGNKVLAHIRSLAESPGKGIAHAGSNFKRAEQIGMKPKFLDFLFNLIDVDHGGDISPKEWKEKVKGPWEKLMFPVLDKSGNGITKADFNDEWDAAVDKAFSKLGGEDDGKISAEEVEKLWKDSDDWEKKFAKKHFMTDGHIDGGEFEEFLYTVMVFRAIDENGDGDITWDEVSANPTALAAFGGPKVKEKFDAYFGEDGMQLDELYKLFNENMVFIPEGSTGEEKFGI